MSGLTVLVAMCAATRGRNDMVDGEPLGIDLLAADATASLVECEKLIDPNVLDERPSDLRLTTAGLHYSLRPGVEN